METNESMSDSQPVREFYLPGTAVLSNVPGRVERWVTGRLADHGPKSRVTSVAERVREFYLPATLRR